MGAASAGGANGAARRGGPLHSPPLNPRHPLAPPPHPGPAGAIQAQPAAPKSRPVAARSTAPAAWWVYRPWWDEAAVVLAVAGLLCAVFLSFAHYGFDLLEEGYFATHARRVQLGGLPYRDFSTPYTPGVFYLYARLMDWFGPDLFAIRVAQVLGRAVFGVVLYALGRRLMPPFFAALPPALILAIDTVPAMWSMHPGWFTTPLSLLLVLAIAQYLRDGRAAWLVAAGLAAGLGFAIKQNLAAYGLMAALWLLVVAERHLPPVGRPRVLPGGRKRHLRHLPFVRPPTAQRAPGERTGRRGLAAARALRVTAQALALALLPLTALALVRAYLSPLVAFVFVLPLAALSVTAAIQVARVAAGRLGESAGPPAAAGPGASADAGAWAREASLFLRPLLVLAGFAVVTLPWLLALIRALDGRLELLAGLVGQIDLSGYFFGMQPPTVDHLRLIAGLLLVPAAVAAIGFAGLWGPRGAALALGAAGWLALARLLAPTRAAGAAGAAVPAAPWNAAAEAHGTWTHLQAAIRAAWEAYALSPPRTTDLILYLPALAFWAALALLLWRHFRGSRSEFRGSSSASRVGDSQPARNQPEASSGEPGAWDSKPETRRLELLRLWYLAAGAALLLNQYPRMDEIHLHWSGGVLFVAGADVLHTWYRHTLRVAPALRASASGRWALRLGLALLPAVAAAPAVSLRLAGLAPLVPLVAPPPAREPHAAAGLRARLEPVGLPGGAGHVWLPAADAGPVNEVVELLRARTAPGEPIFAYPSIPGFYYLADRPNATRFNHLFPGFAAPADQEEMVRQLAAVRYVVWDDGAAHFWVQPGDNAPVTAYIQAHFRVERFIGPYAVLARDAQGPALTYHPATPGSS